MRSKREFREEEEEGVSRGGVAGTFDRMMREF